MPYQIHKMSELFKIYMKPRSIFFIPFEKLPGEHFCGVHFFTSRGAWVAGIAYASLWAYTISESPPALILGFRAAFFDEFNKMDQDEKANKEDALTNAADALIERFNSNPDSFDMNAPFALNRISQAAPAAAAAAAPAVPYQSPSPRVMWNSAKPRAPREVEAARKVLELRKQREKLDRLEDEKIKKRNERQIFSLKAAEPGKSAGYIDSQSRERYYIHQRVIVLFTGDDPPIWYKGTILNVTHPFSQRYYVGFDDGDVRWIVYKDNNIRVFGVKKEKVKGLVPGQRVRNTSTKIKGIIVEAANRSNMITVKVMRPDNSHFIMYWHKSVTAIDNA